MGQTNIGIGGHAIPPQGTRGLGFDTQGRPVYIDAAGVPRLIGMDAAIDNVLASYGVGAEADLPAASAGLVYVTNDTYKIYSGVDTGVYDIRDLTAGQFVTDTYTPVRTTYQYIGTELMPVSGGALDVCSQADVEQAEPTENTKATSALRAWQGFVYWCKNTLFPELNTSDKTIVGSVNEIKTNVVKLETDETSAAIADTDNVRFKSATGYFNRTLLAIKNYVKLGLKASEVVNDSTIVLSPTVKDAFDNADCVAVTSLQDTDMIPFGRANGAVSENKMIPALDAKDYFTNAFSSAVFVHNEQELSDALAAEKETMQICANDGITMSSISNVYAGNVWVTGRKITISGGLSLLNSSSSRAVTRLVFDAAINFTGDSGDGTCIIGATAGIWHLTFRDLTSAKPIKIFASAGAEIHITTRKQLTVAAGSIGTYSLSSDSSLDIIDDDIIVNTNIVIGATYAGPYVIANVPDNHLVDIIEITDVTLTPFSLVPKFETSTDTYTEIANSQQRVTDKSIYIYNNKPFQTGIGLINNTKTLGVYVLNTYGVNRRLVLSDYSGGWTNSTVNVKVVLKENK